MNGAALIAAERQRQIDSEGWTAEHDDEHTEGELALAAVCYAAEGTNERLYRQVVGDGIQFVDPWPWDEAYDKRRELWDNRDDDDLPPTGEEIIGHNVRCLVKAGALIAAEIDRLRRVLCPSDPTGDF